MFTWVDIETTGLDESKDEILELAIVTTNKSLEVTGSFTEVLPWNWSTIALAPNVSVMHTKNNLIQDCYDAYVERRNKTDIVGRALDFLGNPTKSPMCGSSVHFDRAFIKAQMPKLHNWFGYRNIDVSSIEELVKAWNPSLLYKRQGEIRHRGLDDIMVSIDKLRYYVNCGFINLLGLKI